MRQTALAHRSIVVSSDGKRAFVSHAVGPSLASQYSVKCLRPAVAQVFVVKARVLKPGKQQVFTQAELTSLDEPGKLLAVGDTLLVPAGM